MNNTNLLERNTYEYASINVLEIFSSEFDENLSNDNSNIVI